MASEIVKTPYEMLVRWDDSGKLQGASIKWRVAGLEDGKETVSRIIDPEPISVAGDKGFPLSDILEQVHTDALISIETKDAAIAEKDEAIQEYQKVAEENRKIIEVHVDNLASVNAELQLFKDAADTVKQEEIRRAQIFEATAFLAKQGIAIVEPAEIQSELPLGAVTR